MRYKINHTTKYSYDEPVAVGHNLVRLAPLSNAQQTCNSYRLIILPEPSDLVERVDAFGNRVDYFSIQEAHWGLSLSANSELTVQERAKPDSNEPWESVRDAIRTRATPEAADADLLTFPSALAPLVPELTAYAAESFPAGRPVLEALADLTARIHKDFDYDPRATTVTTPVAEAFAKRAGVCQDFAHIEIACLRSLGLAARYVSGYLRTIPPPGKERLVGADASHAWASIHRGPLGWIDYDPTNNCVVGSDHIVLAVGRDYADVPPLRGVFIGGGSPELSVSVDVDPVETPTQE